MLALLVLAGCAPEPADSAVQPGPRPGESAPSDSAAEPELVQLDAVGLLNRWSLDLRGRHPSLDELERVEQDPEALHTLLEELLADPALPERMAWVWNERVHTAVWGTGYTRFNAERGEPYPFEAQRVMGWEPLALFALLVAEDRSLRELVTAQRSAVHPDLPASWAVLGAAEGWGWGEYSDGRPMAGVLSSTAMWLRYSENQTNMNRGRANALARIFLCADFFERSATSFEFSVNFDEVEHAVKTEPVCTSCHASLDPLAAVFGGYSDNSLNLPESTYVLHSALADRWSRTVTPPAYYGHPVTDLAEVGQEVAADPRYAACLVEHFTEALTGLPFTLDEDSAARVLRFGEDGMRLLPLLRELLWLPEYGRAERRVMAPELLQSALEDFTRWSPGADLEQGLNALTWDGDHRVLLGGADDTEVLQRNPALTVSALVAAEWAGRAAAGAALSADRGRDAADRVLLSGEESTDDAVRARLAQWCTRAWGRRVLADSAELDALFALWQAEGGFDAPDAAWTMALEAVLRHPDALVY